MSDDPKAAATQQAAVKRIAERIKAAKQHVAKAQKGLEAAEAPLSRLMKDGK
jgi:hypothetical protein